MPTPLHTAAAATLAIAAVLASASPANAHDKTTTPGNIDAVMLAQQPLTDLVDQIRSAIDQDNLTGFAGTEIAVETSEVILYWYGTLPIPVRSTIENAPEGITLSVREASYSLDTLDAEARRVGRAYKGKVQINQIGPNSDYSGLDVRVDPSVDIAYAESILESSVPITITAAPQQDPLVSRLDDIEPFRGGAAIYSDSGSACSTGFAVKRYNIKRMITAEHCGSKGDNWYTYTSGRYVGTANVTNYSLDTALLNGRDYEPYIYTGGSLSAGGAGVSGSRYVSLGQYVCFGGAFSGEVCGNKVTYVHQYIFGSVGPGYWTTRSDGGSGAGHGDSGGPSYNYSGYHVKATGIISAGSKHAPCNGLTSLGGLLRTCYRDIFSVNMPDILQGLDATLMIV